MKIAYDPRYNIAYIRFREKQGQVETIQVSNELNVDLDGAEPGWYSLGTFYFSPGEARLELSDFG